MWPPGSADMVCFRRPLMTQVQHWAKMAQSDDVTQKRRKRRFSTNKSLYLGNDIRWAYSYNGRLIESWVRTFECTNFDDLEWPTRTTVKSVTHHLTLYSFMRGSLWRTEQWSATKYRHFLNLSLTAKLGFRRYPIIIINNNRIYIAPWCRENTEE